MPGGIIIYGATGAGKTTIGRALAKRLNFHYFDLDDYFWRWDTELPYTIIRPREEVIRDMVNDLTKHPLFVLSGSMGSVCKSLSELVELAVLVDVPIEIRMERLRKRETETFGERILEGGDMHKHNLKFMETAGRYDTDEPPMQCLKRDEQWMAEMQCLKRDEQWISEAPYTVLRLDGTRDVEENAAWIEAQFLRITSHDPKNI